MQNKYYVNKNAQSTGEHEVHKEGCSYLPASENRLFLGCFDNCKDAVAEARKTYKVIDGCYYCCNSCHTR